MIYMTIRYGDVLPHSEGGGGVLLFSDDACCLVVVVPVSFIVKFIAYIM
jgi:hypothetical protein